MSEIDFLKVDTEGCDLAVLEGLERFLEPTKCRILYVEMGGKEDARTWQLLADRGYRAFAAETVYIDRLRELQRRDDSSGYFSPVDRPGDGNLLWCVRGSPQEARMFEACGQLRTR